MSYYGDLLSLIRDGRNDAAKAIIRKFDFYREVDLSGNTLLHHSAEFGNQTITKYLLEGGSLVDAQDNLGFTPLMKALKKSHESIVKTLIDANSDILLLNAENKSSLHLIYEGNSAMKSLAIDCFKKHRYSNTEEFARRFIEAGFELDQVLILQDAKILEYMLEHGGFQVDVSKPCRPQVAPNNMVPLHVAVILYDLESVKVLLRYGTDVNARIFSDNSPLNYVYPNAEERHRDQLEILKVLLDAALPTMTDNSNLSTALIRGPREAVHTLLNLNLDLEVQDESNGLTILHYLAMNVNPGIVDEVKLHIKKFNVNIRSRGGLVPIHEAVVRGNVQMLEYLLQQGTDVNSMDNQHKCPPFVCAYGKLYQDREVQVDKCVEILLQHNADPQFVISGNNRHVTIFDIKMKAIINSRVDRLKQVVAHIALLEKKGTAIIEIIKSKIDAEEALKEYFERCREILDKKITAGITIFQLLTANEKTTDRYLSDEKLKIKLMRIRHCQELKTDYSYYYNTLEKRLTKAFLLKTLKCKAGAAISQLLEYRFDKSNIVIEKIMSYLDELALRQLYLM